MARFKYGASTADYAVNISTGAPVSGAVMQVFTAETDGTAVTDLLNADGTPVTVVTSGAFGDIRFSGPDGVTDTLWLDTGVSGSRRLAIKTATVYAGIADGSVALAKLATDVATQAELDALAETVAATATPTTLALFSLPGLAALGFVAKPGFEVTDSQLLTGAQINVSEPPIGGPLTVKLWKYSGATRSELNTLTVPEYGLRAIVSGMTANLVAGEEVRPEITSVPSNWPGGSGLQISLLSGSDPADVVAAPGPVTGLTATGGGAAISLAWTAPAGGAREYWIRRRETSGTVYTSMGHVSGTTFIDATVTVGTSYTYQVYADNGDNVSTVATAAGTATAATVRNGSFFVQDQAGIGDFTKGTAAGTTAVADGTDGVFTSSADASAAAAASKFIFDAVESGTRVTARFKCDTAGGGFNILTRRTADNVGGIRFSLYYSNILISRRRTADSGHTTLVSATWSATTTEDIMMEAEDTGSVLTLRVWRATSGTRPGPGDPGYLTVAADTTVNLASIPAGHTGIETMTASSVRTVRLRSATFEDI